MFFSASFSDLLCFAKKKGKITPPEFNDSISILVLLYMELHHRLGRAACLSGSKLSSSPSEHFLCTPLVHVSQSTDIIGISVFWLA